MYIYGIKDGIYTREIIIPEGEQINVSDTPIDCTKFTPDTDGNPVEIVVEQPVYVAPTDALYSVGNDTIYASGNDTIYGNLA